MRELKLRLAQAAAVGQRFLKRETRRRCPSSLATRIFEEVQTTLAHNQGALRRRRSTRRPTRCAQAAMIYVFGMGGGSTALSDEMRFRLVRLGRPVASYQDGLLQRMVASDGVAASTS